MTILDLSVGALEIGVLLSTVLYGVATVQAWLYTERNFKDPIWLRIMVSRQSLTSRLNPAHALLSPRLGLSGWFSL
jgi:hypothetical protein